MPRPKKAAGTAVDKRNGIRPIDSVGTAKSVPRYDPPRGLNKVAKEAWDAFWDDRQALLLTPSAKVVLERWIFAVHRYDHQMKMADREPLIESTHTTLMNPRFRIAKDALATIIECEKQLGIGIMNATNLGMAALAEKTKLADLNERYEDGGGDENDRQPEREQPTGTISGELEPVDPRLLDD